MSLLEREIIDKVEVFRDGTLQVRTSIEIYDTNITAKAAIPDEKDDVGNIVKIGKRAISDVKAQRFHRSIIFKKEKTSELVQKFLDNSK